MSRISLKQVYRHLQRMPPPHPCTLEQVLGWMQQYQDSQGQPVFTHLQIASTDPLWQQLSQTYHSQDILCDATTQEIWVRACCHWGNLAIEDESPALSQSRWQALNPLQTQHYLKVYHQHQRRQDALQKMRERQQTRNTE